jgi:hypothetical protein
MQQLHDFATPVPVPVSARLQVLFLGLMSALPTLLLVGFSANPSIYDFLVKIGLLLFIQYDIESGVAR